MRWRSFASSASSCKGEGGGSVVVDTLAETFSGPVVSRGGSSGVSMVMESGVSSFARGVVDVAEDVAEDRSVVGDVMVDGESVIKRDADAGED